MFEIAYDSDRYSCCHTFSYSSPYELFIFRLHIPFKFEFIIWFQFVSSFNFHSLHFMIVCIYFFLFFIFDPPSTQFVSASWTASRLRLVQLFCTFDFSISNPKSDNINAFQLCWCKSLSLWQNKLKIKMFIVVHSPLSQCNRSQTYTTKEAAGFWTAAITAQRWWVATSVDTFRVHKHEDVNGKSEAKNILRSLKNNAFFLDSTQFQHKRNETIHRSNTNTNTNISFFDLLL